MKNFSLTHVIYILPLAFEGHLCGAVAVTRKRHALIRLMSIPVGQNEYGGGIQLRTTITFTTKPSGLLNFIF